MRSLRWGAGPALLGLALLCPPLFAEPPRPDAVADLAARIDRHVAAGYAARGAVPAPPADDAEYIRRVYLDVAGRTPSAWEVREYLADKSPDKRRKVVDRLLDGPHYSANFARVWRELLLPQNNNQTARFFAPQIESWVRVRLREDRPYDAMVRELLTAAVVPGNGPRATPGGGAAFDQGAAAFYQANELLPENIASAASRIFLGVKLECAQCHDHPFAQWKKNQFWEYAAFFSGLRPQVRQQGAFSPAQDNAERHEIKIPNTETVVQARYLDGKQPTWGKKPNARKTLAEWMTAKDNPYFARAAANRVWAHFFGVGIIDPVDDLGTDTLPSHPELLDELAAELVKHRFDLKFLIRAITASKTYQLTSTATHESQNEPQAFARMMLKGLTPEQVFDSLASATGYREPRPAQGMPPGFVNPGTMRSEFLSKFANASDKRTEHQTSILQALSLMNGKFVADATGLQSSGTLGAVLDAPFMDTRDRLDALYLAALSRPMRPQEAARLVPYVNKGGPSGDPRKALADVFWTLLNSSEFILNH
jgi:hypothetical protein